jgi:hypothetical protein
MLSDSDKFDVASHPLARAGVGGVMYAGPVADTAALCLSAVFLSREFKEMSAPEEGQAGHPAQTR